MKDELFWPPGFWSTVRLLLGAARRRSYGRRKRQRELLNHRAGRGSVDWSGLGFAMTIILMISVNGCAAFVVRSAVSSGERIEAERQGKIVVSRRFLDEARAAEKTAPPSETTDPGLTPLEKAAEKEFRRATHGLTSLPYSSEARDIAEKHGGTRAAIEQRLRDAILRDGPRNLVSDDDFTFELAGLPKAGAFPAMWGSVVLIWWALMLIFQGEGLELDLQRRRHPMWEWLFSHPVQPGAVFLAEMISPMAANPIYWGVPLFVGILYGSVYNPILGLLAAGLIGIPIAVAAACLGKALEIGAILRLSSRSRGAMIGFMSWLGYASMMLCFLGAFFIPKVIGTAGRVFDRFSGLPWPWLKLFLGGQAGGSFSFLSGMLTCWAFAGVTAAGAVGISVWGAQKGLSGNTSRVDLGPSVARKGPSFGKDPLYRKEFLWFIRDRSAIVQAILIPMTVAAFQLFNFRSILSNALEAWNYLCGAGLLFGTYFLWVLGPRSLASEGNALWIALTWPRGLESLLKAKAWLWSLIATGMVSIVLCYAAYLFPGDIPGIALVGVGWFFFGRSMAEKTVTLVSVPSSSGEKEKVPMGRQWAAQLGMLTFSIGVLTQKWQLAVVGIVYSYLTAAAMWQNFRARLPYLYDPWSERLPPPPTLMHAMIAISIMVEAAAIITGGLVAFAGRDGIAVAQAIAYAVCAVAVSVGTADFLSNRGVSLRDVRIWPPDAVAGSMSWLRYTAFRKSPLVLSLTAGALGGLLLGLLGLGYVAALQHIPAAAEILRKSQEEMSNLVGLRQSYAVMAVGFAPFAEEYLFRGLLFRALDREWGGWKAVIGSAAFFAIYHAPLFWLPVACVGMVNALLFKKSGRLAPAVVLHMVYNTVVVWAM